MTENTPPEPTGLKMGDLKKLIQDTVMEAVKGVSTPPVDKPDDKVAETGSVADKVRAEIEKIRAREKDETERETLKTQVAALAAAKEQAPVERKRIHKLMGWGENASR